MSKSVIGLSIRNIRLRDLKIDGTEYLVVREEDILQRLLDKKGSLISGKKVF